MSERIRWYRGEGDARPWCADLGGTWRATITPVYKREVWHPRIRCGGAMIAVEGPHYTRMTLARCKAWVAAMLPALDAIAGAGDAAVRAVFPDTRKWPVTP